MNKFERENVQDVYNQIYKEFDYSRYYIWPSVKKFLENIPKYSVICDIGCGNGKNMMHLNNDYLFIGADFSEQLLNICTKKKLEVCAANNCILPFKDNSFDCALSIAVIHHCSSYELRLKALEEIIRITKPNCNIMVQVWAFEREYCKKFDTQDAIIPWKTKTQTYNRYYYLFKENELDNMIKNTKYNIKIIKSYKERDNYIIIFNKLL